MVLGERELSWKRGVCHERVEVVLQERMLSWERGGGTVRKALVLLTW